MPLEPGSEIGDYRVLKLAGSGGMGQVYKVQNLISNRIEALKVVVSDLSSQSDLAERFLREIQVHASLIHPNIAAMHAALRLENQLVMVMEFVEGETLEERIQKGRLPVEDCLHYARQILAALSYAHSKLVIHRDIKPANVIVTPEGTVKIMDFGLASGLTDRRLTRTGVLIGSLHYMAPEQVKGEPATPQTDLYSFGLTLYEMLTGVQGIRGDSDYAVMTAHLTILPDPPTRLNPAVPRALSELVLKMIAKDRLHRFQSADEVRVALERLSERGPVATQPVSPRGVPAWALVAAVIAVVLGAGVFAYRTTFSRPSGPPPGVSAADTAQPVAAQPVAPPEAPPPTDATPVPAKRPAASRPVPPIVAEKFVNTRPVSPPTPSPVAVAPAPTITTPVSPRVATPPQSQPPPAPVQTPPAPVQSTPAPIASPVVPVTPSPQQQKVAEDARVAELQRQRLELEQASMRKEITDVLKRLEAAYASREIQQVRAVWPRLPGDQRARAEELFQQSRSVALNLDMVGTPRITGDRAIVQSRVRLDNQLRSNSKSSPAGGEAAITMVRANGIWVIESVQYTPGGRSLYRPF